MKQKTEDNRTRTLASARRLFFAKGVAKTSTNEIARDAGTSKTIIYREFGNIEGLLQAVIEIEVGRFGSADDWTIDGYDSFRRALTEFGAAFLDFLNQGDTIRFARIMSEQARLHPEQTRLYFDAAYLGTAVQLDKIFAKGAPFVEDPMLHGLSARYISLLKGYDFDAAVLGLTEAPYPNPLETSAACVNLIFPA